MTLRPEMSRTPARMLRGAVLVLPFLLMLAAAPHSDAGQFGIGLFGSYNSYKMEDLNDEIAEINADLEGMGSTERMDEIENGMGFGGGLRYRSPGSLQFALDYERLSAESDVSDGDASFEVEVPANAFLATLTYLMASTSNVRFGFAGGLGYYKTGGTLTVDDGVNPPIEGDLEGSGLGYHAGGVLDLGLSDQMAVNIFAGWRQAKTSDLELDGDPVLTEDGDDATLDWSGVTAKIGLNFFFGMTGAQ
jgi:hypothetical protein